MIVRRDIGKAVLGDYSEMTAAAAFIVAGYEVAFPFGNQYRWDMVVRESLDAEWQAVQVKTVPRLRGGENPTLHVHRQDKAKSPYTEKDVQLLVAVHPESGTLWKVPVAYFSGTTKIKLPDEYLWRGRIERDRPVLSIKRVRVSLEGVHSKQSEQRSAIRLGLPTTKPEWISEATWGMTVRWCNGEGYKFIGKSYGLTQSRIRERIFRGLARLGLKELPAFLKNVRFANQERE